MVSRDWAAARDVDPALRVRIFSLMINHLLVVAGNDGRMHPSHRRQFFRQLAALYRRHRPVGYLPPRGIRGLKHRLVGLGAYPLYALLRAGYRRARPRRRYSPPVPPEVAPVPHEAQPASIL